MDKALRDTLITAQKSAGEIIEEARAHAQQITASAQEQARKILDEAADRAAATMREAQDKTGSLYSGEQRIRDLIEEYKKQIRAVMGRQLDVMEELFTDLGSK